MPGRLYEQATYTAASGPANSCAPSAAVSPQPEQSLPPSRWPSPRRHLAGRRRYSYPPPVPQVPWAAAHQRRSLLPPAPSPVQTRPEVGLQLCVYHVDDMETWNVDYTLLVRREP